MRLAKSIVLMIVLIIVMDAYAASAYWTDINITNNGGSGKMDYGFNGNIYGDSGAHKTWVFTDIYGHMEGGRLHLKQFDYSQEWMEPTFNWWALVAYGEIVNEATFHDATKQIELFRSNDMYTGGTLVENPDDFYMAFKASEVLVENDRYVEGQSWYGWVHVSVADDLTMTLLGSGIDLYGGAVTVGAIPEPGGGLLLLIGGAMLALRRRR